MKCDCRLRESVISWIGPERKRIYTVSAPAAYRVDPAARMTSSCPGGASPFAESSCNNDEVKDGTAVPEICRVLV